MRRIDDAVRRILRVKFRAGLFEHPYAPYQPGEAERQMLRPDAVKAARKAAGRSMVLLKNDGVLPLDPSAKTAVIGPLADDQHDMLGPWWGVGRDEDAVSVFDAIAERSPGATYARGLQALERRAADRRPRGVHLQRRVRERGRHRAAGGSGGARARRDPRDERRGRGAQHDRPAGSAGGAARSDRGDRQAVRRRPLQRSPADAGGHRRRRAGDPRSVVPRRAGRARPSPTWSSATSTRAASCR